LLLVYRLTSHFPVLSDRNATKSKLFLAGQNVIHGVVRAEHEGVENKPVLVLFDALHFLGLVFGSTVVVDDANAYGLSNV